MARSETLKSCCANLYEQDFVKFLLGESYHPGGLALTHRLGELLRLKRGTRVLDVASGRGASAIYLAQTFGCEVVGLDLGSNNVLVAAENARHSGLEVPIEFRIGDAEHLPLPEGSFDAVICECAFCTFPDKAQAAREFVRVLKPGGRIGLSDLTRQGALPAELETLLAWVACIADALPIEGYIGHLAQAGCIETRVEARDEALAQMVSEIRARLTGTELLEKLGKLKLPESVDLHQAQSIARSAAAAIAEGKLGYALILATKA